LGGTVFFGLRSKAVTDAFARYVKLEGEIQHLQSESADNVEKIKQLESLKQDIYHHAYEPKTKQFVPGDRVKLLRIPTGRSWISEHSKIGMTGIVVDYGPGVYEYTIYWSEADYEGEPIDDHGNRARLLCEQGSDSENLLAIILGPPHNKSLDASPDESGCSAS
jgi:hypothetical protein